MNGEIYSGPTYRPIEKSSLYPNQKYAAKWYLRNSNAEDPWISIGDYSTDVVYGENNVGVNIALINYANYKGINVFIRQSKYYNYLNYRCWQNIDYNPILFKQWKMVRRVAMGTTFHPNTDHLMVC